MLVERGKGGRGGEEGKGGNGLETRECGSVPLITGSSWIIVSVTESNQGQIGFSVPNILSCSCSNVRDYLIRRSFVDEMLVGKTNNLESA